MVNCQKQKQTKTKTKKNKTKQNKTRPKTKPKQKNPGRKTNLKISIEIQVGWEVWRLLIWSTFWLFWFITCTDSPHKSTLILTSVMWHKSYRKSVLRFLSKLRPWAAGLGCPPGWDPGLRAWAAHLVAPFAAPSVCFHEKTKQGNYQWQLWCDNN